MAQDVQDAQTLESIPFMEIKSPELADHARTSAVKQRRGLYLLDPAYARGYSIKFATNATVFILCNGTFGNTFPYDKLEQMICRGGRDQGISQGKLFLFIEELEVQSDEPWTFVKSFRPVKSNTAEE